MERLVPNLTYEGKRLFAHVPHPQLARLRGASERAGSLGAALRPSSMRVLRALCMIMCSSVTDEQLYFVARPLIASFAPGRTHGICFVMMRGLGGLINVIGKGPVHLVILHDYMMHGGTCL